MKLDPDAALYLCPVCKKLMDRHHNYEVSLISGLVLGPVCSSDCAHALYIAYNAYYRLVQTEESVA